MTDTDGQSTEQPAGVRASNSDRERVGTILRAAAAEGLLTLEEADERLASAYAATYRHELAPLTADLPSNGRPLYVGSPEARARRDEMWELARHRLIRHAVVAGVVVATAVTLFALFGGPGPHHHFFPGPIIAVAVISLAIHWRRARWGYGPRWGPRWGGPGYGPGGSGHRYEREREEWV